MTDIWAANTNEIPGDTRIAYLEDLAEDEPARAVTICRGVLAGDPDDEERRRLESILEQAMENPVAWKQAVLQWAEEPSQEGWRRLMQFVAIDDCYDRLRDAFAYLRTTSVDADLLFQCLTEHGSTPDVHELVASGEVSPVVVAARARSAPETSKGLWYAMAAQSAFARGDELGVVRWLSCAHASQTDRVLIELNTHRLWRKADDKMRGMLRKKGLAPSTLR